MADEQGPTQQTFYEPTYYWGDYTDSKLTSVNGGYCATTEKWVAEKIRIENIGIQRGRDQLRQEQWQLAETAGGWVIYTAFVVILAVIVAKAIITSPLAKKAR